MTHERREIIVDTASQTLYFRSPWGRPTSTPSVSTADSGGGELCAAATTNVTLDTVDTTISATASAGATSVTVASATGIAVGTTYHLTNKYGQVEQCKVSKIDSTTVHLVDPLQTDFDKVVSSSYGDFEGVEFYYTLQEDDYDDLAEMNIAIATFTAGGLPRVLRRVFDVVYVPLDAPGPLTADAIYERLGRDLARQEPDEQKGEDFGPQRFAAWDVVRRRIYQHGSSLSQWRPAMIVDPSDLFEYGVAVFARICHEQGIDVYRDDKTPEKIFATEEQERIAAFTGLSWLDRTEDKAKDIDEEQPLELHFIR